MLRSVYKILCKKKYAHNAIQYFVRGKNERFARETATDGSQSGCTCGQRFRKLGTPKGVFSLIPEPKKWRNNNNKKVSRVRSI